MMISGLGIILLGLWVFVFAASLGPVAQLRVIMGPVVSGVVAIAMLTFLFISLVVFIGNLREWYQESSGWFDVTILWILVVAVAVIGFGWLAALLTALLCIGVVYYIHLAQD
jgi:cell division protein FtsX